jgi:hypothetical protein
MVLVWLDMESLRVKPCKVGPTVTETVKALSSESTFNTRKNTAYAYSLRELSIVPKAILF